MLTEFINSPCPVCDGTDFEFSFCRRFRDRRLDFDNGIFSGRTSSGAVFSIDHTRGLVKINPWRKRESILRFRIMKECVKINHYRTSTLFIESTFPSDEGEGQLSIPSGRSYDHFYIRFDGLKDERIPEGGGSINFTIDYIKSVTRIITTSGTKILPLVPIDRFDLKNPIGLLNKIESLMVLL